MPTLKDLLNKYDEVAKLANTDTEGWNPKTRMSIEVAKNQAIVELKAVKEQYGQALKYHAYNIYVIGSPDAEQKFASIAEKVGGTLTVKWDKMYVEMANEIMPSINGVGYNKTKTFTSDQIAVINFYIREKSLKMNIMAIPMVNFSTGQVVNNIEDVVSIVRNGVRNALTDEFNKISVEQATIDLALNSRCVSAVVPIVYTGVSMEEYHNISENFMGGNHTLVTPEENVDESSVIKSFNQIKNFLKKTNKKDKEN